MKNVSPFNAGECVVRVEKELSSHTLFYGHGTDNPSTEAQWLVSSVLSADDVETITPETPLTSAQLSRIGELLGRRVREKVPMAYLLQQAWFAGHSFYVDERVLVPRSPIAELIDGCFEPVLKKAPATILDLCCGSGCIGIACALMFPNSKIILADISAEALEVAKININRFGLEHRVITRQSDLFKTIPETFDLIVANPPYVGQNEYLVLPAEYHAEPKIALVSEQQGLEIPLQILSESGKRLSEQGVLILETGCAWSALEKALPKLPFLWLDFEFGGEGVAALKAIQLRTHFQKII